MLEVVQYEFFVCVRILGIFYGIIYGMYYNLHLKCFCISVTKEGECVCAIV